MIDAAFKDALRGRFGSRVAFDEPMSRHTSFRIGGPADVWIEAGSVDDLCDLFRLTSESGVPVTTLGSGTNVLVSDRGIRGVALRLGRAFDFVEWAIDGDVAAVRAGGAMSFKKLVYDAVDRGFAGLEFGEGIPGSVGGGLTMNAGAFGGEIGRVVEKLEGVTGDGRPRTLAGPELAFEYRKLDLPKGFVITAVDLRLRRGDKDEMAARVATAREKRKARQPLGLPNAGSVFKNPPGTFAGRLLEEAGLKGFRVGGAKASEVHANFIVNEGDASADDVVRLMTEMRQRVRERSAVELEPEIKLVGEW